jgi:acetylornithine deacetylase
VTELVELLRELVAIDSTNPALDPEAPGEAEVASFVGRWCERAGLDVSVADAAPRRPNVVAVARGRGGGRTLILNGHTDTVRAGGPRSRAEAVLDGDRLYGRGSYDMKGALAAAMVATAAAAKRNLRGDVILTAVADEEVASVGTEAVVRSQQADAAIVAEPTEERLCVAHKGFVAFEIETRGVAAHGSRPDLGVDAIAHMGPVLVRLRELDDRLRATAGHPLLGTGSLHASLIEGGQEYSSYPGRCLLSGERRTLPGETVEQVEAEVAELLGDVDGEARVTFSRPPFEIDAGASIVDAVRRAAGVEEVAGVPFWADSALLGAAGIPTVLFGPRGGGAHAVEEWVELPSLERCAAVYEAVAADLCA